MYSTRDSRSAWQNLRVSSKQFLSSPDTQEAENPKAMEPITGHLPKMAASTKRANARIRETLQLVTRSLSGL